jgi:hypothetical protein
MDIYILGEREREIFFGVMSPTIVEDDRSKGCLRRE